MTKVQELLIAIGVGVSLFTLCMGSIVIYAYSIIGDL